MELLGLAGPSGVGVVSISPSAVCPTAFASLDTSHSVSLWDLRLPKKNYVRIALSTHFTYANTEEPSEVLFAADHSKVLTIAGSTVQLFDTRQLSCSVECYTHDVELVQFVSGLHPAGVSSTLVIDEDGQICALDVDQLSLTNQVPAFAFGSPQEISSPSLRFGIPLSNYCCGFERITQLQGSPCLFTLGMDRMGVVYAAENAGHPFELSEPYSLQEEQIVNPPMPTCCRALESLIGIGKADGTYTVGLLDLDSDEIVSEELSAPGHATSALCGVEWVGAADRGLLLTGALCGELTVWDVKGFLSNPPEDDEEDEGDLPDVLGAYTTREIVGTNASVVNCMAKGSGGVVLVGDTLGHVVSCDFAQL